jgi:hypothetical protein
MFLHARGRAANPNDPSASGNFVLLGKTFEALQKRLAEGLNPAAGNELEDHEDDEGNYGEDEVCDS